LFSCTDGAAPQNSGVDSRRTDKNATLDCHGHLFRFFDQRPCAGAASGQNSDQHPKGGFMLLHIQVKRAAIICTVFLLLGQQGCASKPARSTLHVQLELPGSKIGIIIKKAPSGTTLNTPERGVADDIGRGAAPATLLLVQSALKCVTYGPIICVPEVLVHGAFTVSGAIGGAVASPPAAKWDQAEAVFRDHLKEQNFDNLLDERLMTFSEQSGCAFQSINDTETADSKPIDYGSLSQHDIRLVLEISEITVQLQAANLMVNPPRRFFTSVRCKIFRANDGTLIDDLVITDDKGDIHPLDDWLFNNGFAFREHISLAAKRMAETIVTELFLLETLPERTVKMGVAPPHVGLIMQFSTISGPEPIYPRPQIHQNPFWRTNRIDTLQPTLRWEPFQGSDVTYDLIIWRSTSDGNPGGIQPTELIYGRTALSEAFHRLEMPLQPDTDYQWTVRARYTKTGRTRITGWAMWNARPSRLTNYMTLGLTKILPDTPPRYYIFSTPRSQERRWYQILPWK